MGPRRMRELYLSTVLNVSRPSLTASADPDAAPILSERSKSEGDEADVWPRRFNMESVILLVGLGGPLSRDAMMIALMGGCFALLLRVSQPACSMMTISERRHCVRQASSCAFYFLREVW